MTELSDEQQLVVRKHALPVVIMGLEKRTVGSMGTLMTTEDALSSVREVGKESSPGCAASSSGSNAGAQRIQARQRGARAEVLGWRRCVIILVLGDDRYYTGKVVSVCWSCRADSKALHPWSKV